MTFIKHKINKSSYKEDEIVGVGKFVIENITPFFAEAQGYGIRKYLCCKTTKGSSFSEK